MHLPAMSSESAGAEVAEFSDGPQGAVPNLPSACRPSRRCRSSLIRVVDNFSDFTMIELDTE